MFSDFFALCFRRHFTLITMRLAPSNSDALHSQYAPLNPVELVSSIPAVSQCCATFSSPRVFSLPFLLALWRKLMSSRRLVLGNFLHREWSLIVGLLDCLPSWCECEMRDVDSARYFRYTLWRAK